MNIFNLIWVIVHIVAVVRAPSLVKRTKRNIWVILTEPQSQLTADFVASSQHSHSLSILFSKSQFWQSSKQYPKLSFIAVWFSIFAQYHQLRWGELSLIVFWKDGRKITILTLIHLRCRLSTILMARNKLHRPVKLFYQTAHSCIYSAKARVV